MGFPLEVLRLYNPGMSAPLDPHPMTLVELPLNAIVPSPRNPRKQFADPGLDNNPPESVEDMAESIKTHGLFLPIRVRPVGVDSYEIISGERRWRACKLAGLSAIPALVVEKHDPVLLAEEQLEENVARLDLDQVSTIDALMDLKAAGRTSDELSRRIHKSKSTISNLLRIAPLLTPAVREAVALTRYRLSDLFILGPDRLDEDTVLMLCEHSRALSRDFRRSLTQYDSPSEIKTAIQDELTKRHVEFQWDDEPTVGPGNEANSEPSPEALAAAAAPEAPFKKGIAPATFLDGALQVRVVPGRKTTFLVNTRDTDIAAQRQAIAMARALLDEMAKRLDDEEGFWESIQRRASRQDG